MLQMSLYSIILIIVSSAFSTESDLPDNSSGCLTDELYGDFTDEELTHLINRRKNVREFMNKNLHRNEEEILYVPIVFHNLYKIVAGVPIHSYCDYIEGSTKPLKDDDDEILETNFAEDGDYTSGNVQNICSERMYRTLEILNAQYLPSGVQFTLHPDYHEMQHDTISGYDGFFDNATGNNLPDANALKRKYNIPNALNIYTTDCLGSGGITTGYTTCASGINGYSPYPWNLKSNEPGTFIVHKDMPGSEDDTYDPNISTLAHEIGHFFSLLHINGTWMMMKGNIPRELVDGSDCDIHGDLICDTPGSPGAESGAWDINKSTGECIYHGYEGEYDENTGILKIGGYDKLSPTPINFNYCSEWGFADHHNKEDYIMAFSPDTTDIPPGCGTLITFDIEGVPIALSDIHVREKKSKAIIPEFAYYKNILEDETITDGCDLPDMWIHITENGNVLYNSSLPIWGFQFNIVGAKILGVSGGKVQDNNFNIQLDHCYNYTNYDNDGYFFGTRGVECNNNNQSEFATECHIDNYFYILEGKALSSLPIGHNFMGPVLLTSDCAQVGHSDYDNTKNGFTEEQFAVIKNSLKLDYTACSNEDACNTGLSIRKGIKEEYLLREEDIEEADVSSCLYPCNKQESVEYYEQFHPGCLITDAEYFDYSQYECSENLLSLNKNIIPQNFGIHQIYPNPFNPITTIDYDLNQNANIQVSIYDINGRLISTLINEFQIAGYHSITWDASIYSSGIYFLNMSAGGTFETKKMVLIK